LAGPCQGKIFEMAQLLQALAVEVQAVVLAACATACWYTLDCISNVKEHHL
jgi:hypothetical protein